MYVGIYLSWKIKHHLCQDVSKALKISSIKQSTQRSMLNIFQMHTDSKKKKSNTHICILSRHGYALKSLSWSAWSTI